MTIIAKALYQAAQLPIAETTLYTAPTGTRTIVDKCTMTNTTPATVQITLRIVRNGGSPGADDTIISAKTLAAGECYTCPEMVGHVLDAGDFISALPSAAASVTGRISGREVT